MSVKIKIIIYFLTVVIIGSVGFIFHKEPALLFTSAENKSVKTVIIDAGHGGLTNTID